MQTGLRQLALGVATAAFAFAFAPAASACGNLAVKQPVSWSPESGLPMNLHYASLQTPTMVGMWRIKFLVGGNQIDFGYTQWHSDGTEFLNSGGRSPSTQNYCLGVWKQTGNYTYRLNHFAIGYDTSGTHIQNINIHEFVRLDQSGNSFDGTFTIDVYDANSAKRLAHVAGDLEGSRITP